MMSIEYIESLATDAGVLAQHRRLEPAVLADTVFLEDDLKLIPNLGYYVPKDWELVKTHFVDSSGFGEEGELSLTISQFMTLVRTEIANQDEIFGWAITQAGQFQVYIGQFRST